MLKIVVPPDPDLNQGSDQALSSSNSQIIKPRRKAEQLNPFNYLTRGFCPTLWEGLSAPLPCIKENEEEDGPKNLYCSPS